MEAVVGLLMVMLLRVSHGVETSCDGRQDGAQCFGALGGTVVLQLMDSASEIFRYQWSKNETTEILHGRKNVIISNLIGTRYVFTPSNGTFRINSLSRTDAGEYTLQTFDSDGHRSEQRTLQLTIQAPVSSVLLVSECLSQGEMWVSCSSEGGDSPEYSWTLDGRTVTEAELLSGNTESENITLKQDVSGQLVCSVRNHVNRVSKDETISTCGFIFIDCTLSNGTHISQWVPEANNTLCITPTTVSTITTSEGKEPGILVPITPSTNFTSSNQNVTSSSTDAQWYFRYLPVMAGVLSALLILLIVGVTVVCVHKKKQSNKPKEEEDVQDLTYADVRIVPRQGRPVQQRTELEVEYGQVKFSERSRQTAEPRGEDCVYAMVRKGR